MTGSRTAVLLIFAAMIVVSVNAADTLLIPFETGARETAENFLCRSSLKHEIRDAVIEVMDPILIEDQLIGYSCRITPRGCVVVSPLMETNPVIFFSSDTSLDINSGHGMASIISAELTERYRRLEGGTLYHATWERTESSGLPMDLDSIWERMIQWNHTAADTICYQDETVGPLLVTRWHQGPPFNRACPPGNGNCLICPSLAAFPKFPSLVGCVGIAVSQILYYHQWPLTGTCVYSYLWNGDDTCWTPKPGAYLTADLTNPYDWLNMPWSDSDYSDLQASAVSELCAEVAFISRTDFGVCRSDADIGAAMTAIEEKMRYMYHNAEQRSGYGSMEWFLLIKDEIDENRPVLYGLKQSESSGHAVVCDGWRRLGDDRFFHLNYGWENGTHTGWYTAEAQMAYSEMAVTGIKPDWLTNATPTPGVPTATPTKTPWEVDVVTHIDGVACSIQIDNLGKPRISYSDGASQTLFYAVLDGSCWSIEAVEPLDVTGGWNSLALRDGKAPSIAFATGPEGLRQYLYCARGFNGSWSSEQVNPGSYGGEPCLRLDTSGQPHIAYTTSTRYPYLEYARQVSGDWQIQSVDAINTSGSPSLAFRDTGDPCISYVNRSDYDLHYAAWDGASWVIEMIDDGAVIGQTALAVTSSGMPVIAYCTTTGLRCAFYTGVIWDVHTIDPGVTACAMVLGDDDSVHISYNDTSIHSIKYAYYTGDGFHRETVDTSGVLGSVSAIALGPDGCAHIVYADNTHAELKYARRETAP